MSGYVPAAAGTVVVVHIVRIREWKRYPVVAWEVLDLEEGRQILSPFVASGSYAEPWSVQMYPAGEKLRTEILSEADDRCTCPKPESTPEAPLACTSCGRHLRERWSEAGEA